MDPVFLLEPLAKLPASEQAFLGRVHPLHGSQFLVGGNQIDT